MKQISNKLCIKMKVNSTQQLLWIFIKTIIDNNDPSALHLSRNKQLKLALFTIQNKWYRPRSGYGRMYCPPEVYKPFIMFGGNLFDDEIINIYFMKQWIWNKYPLIYFGFDRDSTVADSGKPMYCAMYSYDKYCDNTQIPKFLSKLKDEGNTGIYTYEKGHRYQEYSLFKHECIHYLYILR
eukprot:438046_1